MTRGVFVTGTDTGVGKTLVSCALLHALRAAGHAPIPMKPIAAGAVQRGGRWINEDTEALLAAAGMDASRADAVTPVLLREAMAPHIAAEREGRRLTLEPVRAEYERLRRMEGFRVVEGVGGFCVPLGDAFDTVHLARYFQLPVLLVVGLRLGCLNHALLTSQAVAAAGLPLAGWIANEIDPAMAAIDENVAALAARLPAPMLGRLPFLPGADAATAAARIDLRALLRTVGSDPTIPPA
ncbi:MAG TPA: dethiobiotin synthase [Usitatibacter sp.]|nr:dethiobiotin synthase [Usitatibacter sp.]